MRSRQRGGTLGLLLLASQIFQVGINNIPPVTLAVLGLNVWLFLRPMAPLMQACLSVQQAYWRTDWRRLLLAPLHHADDWHLYYNMASLLWKGPRLECRVGGAWLAYLLCVFTLLTGVVYLLLALILSELTGDPSYSMQCAVGFSGVLFALKVVNNYYDPGGVTHVMGIPVANQVACWVELVVIHVVSPGTSFIGHLAGILVGLLYVKGPLKMAMNTCAGLLALSGYNSYRNTYRSSGYSGHRGAAGDTPGAQVYTAGLSEEEQYEAAIRASLNDRGGSTLVSPPYGFNAPQWPATAEELRQRRLQRFDR